MTSTNLPFLKKSPRVLFDPLANSQEHAAHNTTPQRNTTQHHTTQHHHKTTTHHRTTHHTTLILQQTAYPWNWQVDVLSFILCIQPTRNTWISQSFGFCGLEKVQTSVRDLPPIFSRSTRHPGFLLTVANKAADRNHSDGLRPEPPTWWGNIEIFLSKILSTKYVFVYVYIWGCV